MRSVPPAGAPVSRRAVSPTRPHRQLASVASRTIRFRLGHRESRPARLGRMVGDLWRRSYRLRISHAHQASTHRASGVCEALACRRQVHATPTRPPNAPNRHTLGLAYT